MGSLTARANKLFRDSHDQTKASSLDPKVDSFHQILSALKIEDGSDFEPTQPLHPVVKTLPHAENLLTGTPLPIFLD